MKAAKIKLDDNVIRQGDVLLRRVTSLPEGLIAEKRDKHGHVVMALGERTGHRHAFREAHVTGFRFDNSEYDAANGFHDFLLVGGANAVLKHELVDGTKAEHDAIPVVAGHWEQAQQVEHVRGEIIREAD